MTPGRRGAPCRRSWPWSLRRRGASAQVDAARDRVARADGGGGRPPAPPGPTRSSAAASTARWIRAIRTTAIIQDLALAPRNARGRAEYVATFALARPVDLAEGVGRADLQRRQPRQRLRRGERRRRHLAGQRLAGRRAPTAANQTITVPSPATPTARRSPAACSRASSTCPRARRRCRSVSRSIGSGPPAYPPADLEQRRRHADRASRSESHAGVQERRPPRCRATTGRSPTAAPTPFPGTPDPTRICVKGGFDPARLYQLVYTASDPLVLGVGLAATRDIVSFFRSDAARRAGHAEPGRRRDPPRDRDRRLAVGQLHQDLHPSRLQRGRAEPASVWDGVFPRIAARQTPINFRFGAAGRRGDALRGGQRAGVSGGAATTDTARGRSRGQPARSLHRLAHLSEDRRGVRVGGVLGAAHVARSVGTDARTRHPAARQRPPLLLPRHDARRRTRRLPRRRRTGAARLRAARESRTPRPTRRAR